MKTRKKINFKHKMLNFLSRKNQLKFYIPALLSLVLGVGISVSTYKNVNQLEQQKANAIFERKVSDLVNQLQDDLDRYSRITRFLGLTYELQPEITSEKFELLSQKILPHNRDILAIGEIKIKNNQPSLARIKLNYQEENSSDLKNQLADIDSQKFAIQNAIENNVMIQRQIQKEQNKFIIYQSIESENESTENRIIFIVYDLSETISQLLKINPSISLDFYLYNTSVDRLQSSLMKPQLENSIKPLLNYKFKPKKFNEQPIKFESLRCNLDPEWFQCLRSLVVGEDEMTLLVVPDLQIIENNSLFSLGIGLSLTIAVVIYFLMSARVQKYYLALEVANNGLEEKVKKRTSQLQKAKELAETALLAKDRFLVNISHELRSPLNSVLGYTNSLLKSSNLESQELLSLRIIRQSGIHLLSLINDILDYSKAKANKIELQPIEIHLPSFLEEIIGMVKIQAREKGIGFRSQISESLPLGIKADAKRLRQILLNLLNNAIKFTDSGEVILEVVPGGENEIKFRVIDTGIGINKTHLKKIFQPFQQAGNEDYRAKGTGLGLSITKQLLKLMDSKIKVKSQLGMGSVFYFNLMVDIIELEKSEFSQSALEIVGYKGEKRKILIVDDVEVNRLLLRYILQALGFETLEAANGKQGLNLAQNYSFDLILTDLLMPCKSGLTMVTALRKMPNYQNIPILAVSASSREIMANRSREAGCNDFISKPISEPELLQLIQKYLKLEWVHTQRTFVDIDASRSWKSN